MTLTVDQAIGTYIKLRTQKDALEAKVKDDVHEIKQKLHKIEGWIQEQADTQGVKSFKTDQGTAFLTTTDLASVGDWDAMLNFIRENNAWDLLEKRVSKRAARGYIDLNGAVPDGVNFGSKVSINVRKPAKRG